MAKFVEKVFGSVEAFHGRHEHAPGVDAKHLKVHENFENALDGWANMSGLMFHFGMVDGSASDGKGLNMSPETKSELVKAPLELAEALELYVAAHR